MEIIVGSTVVPEAQQYLTSALAKNKANEWVHYAGTFSRADGLAVLYINGENVGEGKKHGSVHRSQATGVKVHGSALILITTVRSLG